MGDFSTFDELEQAWVHAPSPLRDRGRVELVVIRTGDGVHQTPAAGTLSATEGLIGDRWSRGKPNKVPDMEEQITLMMVQVARPITDESTLHLPGDNFLVDLDLSEECLPAGSQLRIGDAVVAISSKPHTGCKKFVARFGPQALRWVNWKEHRGRRLRGVNCRVIQAGSVEVGSPIRVIT